MPLQDLTKMEPTFELVTTGGVPGFKCLVCQRVSYNKNDIMHKYCAHCHIYHEPSIMPHSSHYPLLLAGCS